MAFPQQRIIIVNNGFIRTLLSIRPTYGSIEQGINDSSSDFIRLKLERPLEGVVPYSEAELNEKYSLVLASYVVLHEIGHVVMKRQHANYSDIKSTYELEADKFFLDIVDEMMQDETLVQQGIDLRKVYAGMISDALHIYASYISRREFGVQANDLIYGKGNVVLRQYILASHPHMLARICNLFSQMAKMSRPHSMNQATMDGYARLEKRLDVTRTIWPF
jgi:hypothetical protein